MRKLSIGLILVGLVACGCGSTRPGAGPLLQDFKRLERDAQVCNPVPPASGMLSAAQVKRDEAAAAEAKGNDDVAYPLMESALADARTALAAAQAAEADQQGGECVQAVEKERRAWDDVLGQLVQTEQVAKRTSPEAPHELQGAGNLAMPELPPSTITGVTPPRSSADSLAAAANPWLEVAAAHKISTAEVENRLNRELDLARSRDLDQVSRLRHLYVAGRALQELEARVRIETSRQLCAQAADLLTTLSEARASALHGILELERGMKDELRTELETTRAAAADRATHLFDALQPFENGWIHTTRDGRGIVGTLSTDSLFTLGKDVIVPGKNVDLVRLATILNQFPDMKIAIEGSTDNVGEPDYNLGLSKRRATSVYNFLLAQGLAGARVSAEGFGMNRPITNNTTDDERRQNRRVDLIIQKQP